MASVLKVDTVLESTPGAGTNFGGVGSASVPTLSIGSQTNKGFYDAGSNKIGISVGGSKVGEIDPNGITINVPYACFVDEKSNNTFGGTFTSGDWRTRVLNTTRGTNSITGSSLSSNQFILPTGTYRIFAMAPAYYCGENKAKLRNITDSIDTIIGSNARSGDGGGSLLDGTTTISIVNGIFTINSQKTFELQHRCQTTRGTDGFGKASNFSVSEIYSTVELWKLS